MVDQAVKLRELQLLDEQTHTCARILEVMVSPSNALLFAEQSEKELLTMSMTRSIFELKTIALGGVPAGSMNE